MQAGSQSKTRLTEHLSLISNASFLWADLAVQMLARILPSTDASIESIVLSIPKNLFGMHGFMLWTIPPQNRRVVSQVLTMVVGAVRPLHINELLDAFTLYTTPLVAPPSQVNAEGSVALNQQQDIFKLCGGLLQVSENNKVQLVHTSLKDFLLFTEPGMLFLAAGDARHYDVHESIAQVCLRCIFLTRTDHRVEHIPYHFTARPELCGTEHQFAQYAFQFWSHHYRLAEAQSSSLPGMLQYLLEIEGERLLKNPYFSKMDSSSSDDFITYGLEVCSELGLGVLEKIYLEMGADPNSTFEFSKTPLHLAVASGKLEIVRTLLDAGAFADSRRSIDQTTPLHIAAARGYTTIVSLLVQDGADVNSVTWPLRETPLHLAVARGNIETIQLLLELGADDNAVTFYSGDTVVHLAAAYGHLEELLALLGYQPLSPRQIEEHQSVWYSRHHTCYWLESELGKGIDSNLKLKGPSISEHDDRENMMLRNKAKLQATNRQGWTALHFAAYYGHATITEVLLGIMDDWDLKDRDGYTPLDYAAENEDEAIVELLLERGVFSNQEAGQRQDTLEYAAKNGYAVVVKLLLERDSISGLKAAELQSALQLAIQIGHSAVVQLLLDGISTNQLMFSQNSQRNQDNETQPAEPASLDSDKEGKSCRAAPPRWPVGSGGNLPLRPQGTSAAERTKEADQWVFVNHSDEMKKVARNNQRSTSKWAESTFQGSQGGQDSRIPLGWGQQLGGQGDEVGIPST